MTRLKRWGRELLLFVVLLAGVLWAMDLWRAPHAPLAFADQPLQTLDGRDVTLAALSAERPLLVYFWASWCGVCRFVTPQVAELASSGQNVISVALRSGEDEKVQRYLQAKRYPLATINDPQGSLSGSWQIGVTPTLVVIDKGAIVSTTTGWTSSWGIKLRLWWAGRR
ncbi:alkyl hydroperoxide reductase [bacteria symbiont BFo1 of Frankliniella occidentalis]|jgi:thiol-disulfide isomerase/thioredoxin|uniref:Protein disulfide oxidoreductase n=1 Tax=Erwinia aphidicola TaxID=68334 RepID=A0ABU8D9X1_ERWAP|nr:MULTISPECIES: protein disulfide oxidoreductase [Erwinia]KMV67948.1 alkyl hydroperoxide reductase [bacteria symbiont BFo1 of Frankliniella occidentalis]PIJ58281.1 protein disulfide oxidoreductase [Erwinia sp. OLMDLW33]KYP83988.1 alkyl hydroperoxide reductase [bacteria symbiont BFo1 of Frankliniella occidentalis]KYP89363.1 alkyl hydroperoxide reductase [bacteria symbiont BFo1 of Frankliniella occidentalis]MBD1376749.1 protein disulfide oxidoreductase [Erwinia aphidicola]